MTGPFRAFRPHPPVAALAIALFVLTPVTHAAGPAAVTSESAGKINVESLAKLDNPWGMTFLPDGRLLITEKPGNLRLFADGKLSAPVAGVPAVAYRGQGGLLGVAIDPDFADNRLVYLFYAEPAEQQPPDARDTTDVRLGTFFKPEDHQLKGGTVARGKLSEDGAKLEDVKVISDRHGPPHPRRDRGTRRRGPVVERRQQRRTAAPHAGQVAPHLGTGLGTGRFIERQKKTVSGSQGSGVAR